MSERGPSTAKSPQNVSCVFVLGTGRCGSTLLQEVLAKHEGVGFVSNVDDRLYKLGLLGRWNNSIYRHIPARRTQKGRLRFAPSEGYRIMSHKISPLVAESYRDLSENDATPWLVDRFRRFFGERAAAQGRPVFLHKFTGWPRAAFIHRCLPEAKFVHVVRDGRAVANSLLQMPWWPGYAGASRWPLSDYYQERWEENGKSFVALAGLEWNVLLDAFEAAEALIPRSQWLELRYEDFIEEPRRVLSQLLEFADLDWSPRFSKAFAKFTFSRDRTLAYERDLSPDDVQMLARLLKRHLQRYGYISGEALSEASGR
jgi:hypothetical protein